MAPVSNVADRLGGEGQLSIDDCLCPVCLEIFLEPVTLPCTHTFCKSCFLESVDKATQCCPMCRKRVSTWTRHNSRNKTLVNEQLWRRIQRDFPLQCQRRLSGQDTGADDHQQALVFCPRVSQPGEVRREYQDQVSKLTEEKRVLDEAERRASEEFIQKLLAAEEAELQAERERRDEDERMARMLSQQLNPSPVSQENLQPANVTPAKKKVAVGQIEKFLCPRSSKPTSPPACSSAANLVSTKVNVPMLDYYGASTHDRDRQRDQSEPSINHAPSLSTWEAEPSRPEIHDVTDAGGSSSKRKSSELETTEKEEEEQERCTKRGCPSSSSSSSMEAGPSAPWRLDLEEELLSRRQQEEEDRRVALLLQKELNQQERQRATNRTKGSADAYLLRQQHRGRGSRSTKAKISPAPSPAPSTACSSTPGSAPPSSRASSSKQTTLTKMFSSLSS